MSESEDRLRQLVAPDPQKAVSTSKKLKRIDHRRLVDPETGEVVEVGQVVIEEGDANFEKIWLGHVLDAIDEIGTKKIGVLLYLFRNRNNENIVVKTNKQIAEDLNLSYATVANTLAALVKHEIIKRGVGHIMINPNVIFKGSYKRRMDVLLSYRKEGETPMPPPTAEEQAAEIMKKINELLKQLSKLTDVGVDPQDVKEMLSRRLN